MVFAEVLYSKVKCKTLRFFVKLIVVANAVTYVCVTVYTILQLQDGYALWTCGIWLMLCFDHR